MLRIYNIYGLLSFAQKPETMNDYFLFSLHSLPLSLQPCPHGQSSYPQLQKGTLTYRHTFYSRFKTQPSKTTLAVDYIRFHSMVFELCVVQMSNIL